MRCHGYANCCRCDGCVGRRRIVSRNPAVSGLSERAFYLEMKNTLPSVLAELRREKYDALVGAPVGK